MQLSDRINSVAPSLTLAVDAKAKALKAAGEDVVGFGAGEPDFDTPEPIKQAAIDAIRRNLTRYTAVDGVAELKTAIQRRFELDHGLKYSHGQIAVTVGAKQALYNLFQATVNPGDGVLIGAPYWVSYPDLVRLAGGEPQIVATQASDGFCLRADAVAAAVKKNSKILVINSPSNPTGAGIDRAELEKIGELALRHNLWIISDEIYEKLVFGGFKQSSIAALSPELYNRTIVVNGVSKTYAMTGWRIGYMAGAETVVKAAVKLQGQSTSNPTSISQYATIAALGLDGGIIEEMRQTFEKRRDLIVKRLNAIKGVTCPTPQGAFYVFPDVSQAIAGRFKNTIEFADALIQAQKVAVVPGEGFGGPGHIRLSYACSTADIERGLDRIAQFLA